MGAREGALLKEDHTSLKFRRNGEGARMDKRKGNWVEIELGKGDQQAFDELRLRPFSSCVSGLREREEKREKCLEVWSPTRSVEVSQAEGANWEPWRGSRRNRDRREGGETTEGGGGRLHQRLIRAYKTLRTLGRGGEDAVKRRASEFKKWSQKIGKKGGFTTPLRLREKRGVSPRRKREDESGWLMYKTNRGRGERVSYHLYHSSPGSLERE